MSFLKQAPSKQLECSPGQGHSARYSEPWTATQFRIAPNSATTDTCLFHSSLCFSRHISDHQKARSCNHICVSIIILFMRAFLKCICTILNIFTTQKIGFIRFYTYMEYIYYTNPTSIVFTQNDL